MYYKCNIDLAKLPKEVKRGSIYGTRKGPNPPRIEGVLTISYMVTAGYYLGGRTVAYATNFCLGRLTFQS